MTDKLKVAAGTAAAIAALGLGGAAIAGASGPGSDTRTDKPVAAQESDRGGDRAERPDKPIAGQALQRAQAVALQATGGGKVTDTEVGDEEGAYEVEVTRADGSQVDVHLDKGFNVLNQSSDGGNDDERGHQD
jgi:uncharacterized membrane protein YkoI